jgi:hypothetical protein
MEIYRKDDDNLLEDSKESVEIELEEEAQGDKVLVDFHNQD